MKASVMKFGTASASSSPSLGIAMGATMEGTNVMVVINIPAMLIVLVGTLGATIVGSELRRTSRASRSST